jgi:Protein of unknown function (DUF2934)
VASSDESQVPAVEHGDIQRLAFQYWLERGAPIGTPETDWFRAEQELTQRAGHNDNPLASLAKEIGAALGSIAALAGKTRNGPADLLNSH